MSDQNNIDQRRRKIEIDYDEMADLIEKVAILTDRVESVPHEQHDEHHRFVDAYIKSKRQREDFWRDVREKLITKGIFGTVWIVFWVLAGLTVFWWNNKIDK